MKKILTILMVLMSVVTFAQTTVLSNGGNTINVVQGSETKTG
jgi:hypothetical protein